MPRVSKKSRSTTKRTKSKSKSSKSQEGIISNAMITIIIYFIGVGFLLLVKLWHSL